MITWNEASKLHDFWASLEGRPVILIMDYDGTLAPFVPHPPDARPYPGVSERLDRLAKRGVRLVFVTGRDCRQLPEMLGLAAPPEVWGSHGGEHLEADGRVTPLVLSTEQQQGIEQARSWADSAGYGRAVEMKPGGVAFHVRGLPEELRESVLRRARTTLEGVANAHGLILRGFDGGLELRSPDVHKGLAVRQVQDESTQDAALFFLGDDDTDEDAFAALDGRGTGILVRGEARESHARWWLRPPEELICFLDVLLGAGFASRSV